MENKLLQKSATLTTNDILNVLCGSRLEDFMEGDFKTYFEGENDIIDLTPDKYQKWVETHIYEKINRIFGLS